MSSCACPARIERHLSERQGGRLGRFASPPERIVQYLWVRPKLKFQWNFQDRREQKITYGSYCGLYFLFVMFCFYKSLSEVV